MTQADRVHSTPPTNTSVHPASRRGFLAQAAAAVAGGATLDMALPVSAGAPEFVSDPIYTIIEKHRELSARYDAAVSISAKPFDGPECDAAEEVTAAACTELLNYADSLVSSPPTTLAGVIALLRYAADMQEWEMPRDVEGLDEDGELTGWSQSILRDGG